MRTRLVFVLVAVLAVIAWGWWYSPLHQVRSIFSLVTVDAPANRVWQTVADLDGYRGWNPFLTTAGGALAPGSRLTIAAKFGTHTITFHPRLLAVEANRRLVWQETIVGPALFEEEHEFEIETLDQSHTRLIQSARFRGVLVGMVWKRLLPELSRGMGAMNEALKRRCEQMVANQR